MTRIDVSIRAKLNAFFILIVTALLGVFGALNYLRDQSDLEASMSRQMTAC